MGALHENCGIAGIYGDTKAAELLYLSLFSLQHRGEESCGMVVAGRRQVRVKKGMGLVPEVFSAGALKEMQGFFGVGHTRYSTTGGSTAGNIQPFVVEYKGKTYAVAHNGNIISSKRLRKELEEEGSVFQTTLDTEILVHLITRSRARSFTDKLLDALAKLDGAFSLVIFTPDGLIAAKDPWSFRPLCLGRLERGGYAVASESCAFDLIGAEYIRELDAGEVLRIGKDGLRSSYLPPVPRMARCVFEFVYFSRPDSAIFNRSVYGVRKKLGETLAGEFPYRGDTTIPIPDSGTLAALGFAQKTRTSLEMGVIKNHYVGRTFIRPLQASREIGVKIKLNPVKKVVNGKAIIVIDDSIVRGTTNRIRIKHLRAAGARKIYMGVSCPPIRHPCFYGIDFPDRRELIAGDKSPEQVRAILGLDGLYYLSLEGMLASTGLPAEEFCTACFTGDYRVTNRRGHGIKRGRA